MNETVEIGKSQLEQWVAVSAIQEDSRYCGFSMLKHRLEKCLRDTDNLSDGELAERLRQGVTWRVFSGYLPREGEDRLEDLCPVGEKSIFGKILLELAKRLEKEQELTDRSRKNGGAVSEE